MERIIVFILSLGILASCTSRADGPVLPAALQIGVAKTVFVGTTRAMSEGNIFGFNRSEDLRLMRVDVSVPPDRLVGSINQNNQSPNPQKHFVMASRDLYSQPSAFQRDVRQAIGSVGPRDRELTVFVHGYNSSFSDAAFRVAQMAHDLELKGALASYAWPSRGNPLAYEYDRDSVLFARDGLQEMLTLLTETSAPRLVLIAHSMGGKLLMETLRQFEIGNPGWVDRNVEGILLISPDLNPEVFRKQIETFETVPENFLIVVSRKDRVLGLSAFIRGDQERLGNLKDSTQIADLPVSIVDVTAFTDSKSGNHLVGLSSPALIKLMRGAENLDAEFLRGRSAPSTILATQTTVADGVREIVLRPSGEDR